MFKVGAALSGKCWSAFDGKYVDSKPSSRFKPTQRDHAQDHAENPKKLDS
jgi:hypothetical protein